MLSWINSADYLALWLAFLLLFVLTLVVGDRSSVHLKNREKYQGRPMGDLELAGSPQETQRVLDEAKGADEGEDTIKKFRTALGWDYLFIFIYPLCGAVGCLLVIKFLAEKNLAVSPVGQTIGFVLLALLPLAALLDAVEDYALLRVLGGTVESPWPEIARWCALPKFAIVYAVLGYELLGAITWAVTKFLIR